MPYRKTASHRSVFQTRFPSRDLYRRSGPYPVYSSQTKNNGIMGHLDTFDFEGDYLTWTTDGANAGTVFFRTGKFNCTNVCGAGKARNLSDTSAKFYAYYLNTVAWKHVSHVGNPKLMSGPFGNIPVIVPPLHEQQAIAAALSDADGVVAKLERVIAKKRLIKQGAMQDLLTACRRLPGFSGEWEVRPFAQIARIRNSKVQTLGNPVAQSCIELEQIEHETGRVLFWVDATARPTVKYQFEPEDVLFGRLRPYLRKFHRATVQGVCSTEIWPLMSQGIDSSFLFQVVQSNGFVAAACEAYGTHMPRADWGKLATYEVQVPVDPKEQVAIGEALNDMEKEIQTLEARLAKARAVKEGMMQNLLTGRVRLV